MMDLIYKQYLKYLKQQMTLFSLIVSLVCIGVVLYFSKVLRTKKLMEFYKKEFQGQGYRVLTLKFNAFGMPKFQAILDGVKNHKDAMNFFRKACQGYDIIISNNFISNVSLTIISPELYQEMCDRERQWCYIKEKQVASFVQRIFGKGIVSSQQEVWKRKRRVLNQNFNFNFVSGLTNLIIDKANQSFQHCESIANITKISEGNVYEFPIMEMCQKIVSNVVFEGFLGGNLKQERLEGKQTAKFLMEISQQVCNQSLSPISILVGGNFFSLGLLKKHRELNQKIKIYEAWAKNYISRRSEEQQKRIIDEGDNYTHRDIISSIILNNHKIRKQGNEAHCYTEAQILDELKTFFVAGTDTTSHYLQVLFYYVSKYPQVEQKLRQEIEKTVKNNDFSYDDIKNMPYLDAIQKQTIRLAGPGSLIFPRTSIKDHQLKGAKILAGTHITHQNITVHYSKDYYEYPQSFRPERWLNNQCKNNPSHALGGFHGGPRACIGKKLALLQSKITLILFMKRYKKLECDCDRLEFQMKLVLQAQNFKIKATKY